jgi:adenylate cyclase
MKSDFGADKGFQRRLAAIVFADVAGYSRLMHEDESGTITALKKHLSELIEPVIAEHSGRLVKTTGDGILVEFSSAVAAVTASIDIQRGMMLRNNQVPEDRRIEFRIGVNLSEIVVDNADILGDGVNVAARLEGLADANGICVSDEIQRIVRNKIDAGIESVGDVSLKNMPKPIKVYRISVASHRTEGAGTDHESLQKTATAQPLLAVLPFANLSQDQDQSYFSDGVTSDIISNLSRFPELGVIASHSVFAYKSRPTGIAAVAEDLGVRYVVEGNVQRSQSIVRINVQLIDAHADRQLWSDRFQGKPNEIFEMQEEITRKIAARVISRVEVAERGRSLRKAPDSLEAYDFLLRGFRVWYLWTPEANREAQDWFAKALALDSNYARAHSAYSYSLLQASIGGWTPAPDALLRAAHKHAQIAVALAPFDFDAYEELGLTSLYMREFDRSIDCYERALSLNPNCPDLRADLADALAHIGRTAEASQMIAHAKQLNPIHPEWYDWVLGIAAFHDGRYEDALSAFSRFSDPPALLRRDIVATYVRLGQIEEARKLAQEILAAQPEYRLATENLRPYKNPDVLRGLISDLRLAGLPD